MAEVLICPYCRSKRNSEKALHAHILDCHVPGEERALIQAEYKAGNRERQRRWWREGKMRKAAQSQQPVVSVADASSTANATG